MTTEKNGLSDGGVRSNPIRTLLVKELRQVARHRSAMLSLTLLPILVMVIVPVGQFLSIQAVGMTGRSSSTIPANLGMLQGLAGINDPSKIFTLLILPLMMVVGGLATPSVLAIHTIVVERERRTLELLIALPVSIRDIITAKLLAVLVLSSCVVLPLFAIDVAVGMRSGLLTVFDSSLLLLVLLAAVACSGCFALVLALVARDFRTANNINGAMVGPIVLVSVVILGLVPGPMRLIALALLLTTVGVTCVVVAMKWLTFERYIG